MLDEQSMAEGLTREVLLQGLDVTSDELVNGTRKDCENPLTKFPVDLQKCAKFMGIHQRKL
jgi:hypothetical protein